MLRHVAPLGLAAVVFATAPAEATSAPAEGVRWKRARLELVADASLGEAGPQALARAQAAARAWQAVGAETPEVSVVAGTASPIGYVLGGQNQSTLRLATDGEPLAKGALAVTVVTYEASTGTILDADVILNGIYRFSDGSTSSHAKGKHGSKKHYDLQAVLTHELGHLHGLGDDYEHTRAAMYAKTAPEDAQKRVLSAEDEAALLSLYGEAGEGSAASAPASCASGPARPASAAWASAGLLLALGLVARRRRGAGVLLAFAGGLALTTTPAAASDASEAAHAPHALAVATVAGVTARWEGGLIVSELELADVSCAGDCEGLGARVRVAGGRVGDVVQVVSHVDVPETGARVVIEVNEARNR